MNDPDFGDIEADDVYTEGDDEVNWDQVETVASQIESIEAIEDSDERLDAAKAWASELEGA